MCFPLKFSELATRDSLGFLAAMGVAAGVNAAHGQPQNWNAAGHRNICPRKSAALQMCRQISVTVNSSVSQSTRPGEWCQSMDDIFGNQSDYLLPGEGDQETGRFDSFCVASLDDGSYQGVDGVAGTHIVGHTLNNMNRFINVFGNEINKGGDYRRQEFLSGVSADGATVVYTAVSCIPLSPFMHYKYPSAYRKKIPYCDQIEVNVNFKANVKPWLLQGFRRDEAKGATVATNYKVQWNARPYLKVIFASTPLAIPPSITVPSNRFVNYEVVQAAAGPAGSTITASFNSLRFEVWPDLIVINAQETDAKREAYPHVVGWKPYFCPVVENSLKVTIGGRGPV